MIKKIFITIIVLTLSGCTALHAPHYKDEAPKKDCGVVVLKLRNASFMRVVKFDKNYNDIKLRNEITISPNHFMFSDNYNDNVYVLEPGLYFISYVYGSNYNTTNSGINHEGDITYGAFIVKSGEVTYLGEWHFAWYDKRGLIRVYNNIDKAKQDLSKDEKHNNLVSRLQKGKIYLRGSRIVIDNNEVATLVYP